MFLRNDSDQMSSSSPSYTTTRTPARSSNKLLRAMRRKPNAPPPPTASPATSKIPWLKAPSRALVVGINEYKAPFISDLRGCVADANDVVSFLTEKLAMPEQNILLLTSPAPEPHKQATRAAIIDGIQHFLSQTPPGEEALFYFSGHGSTCHLSEQISFGYEKGYTLVPSDARQDGIVDLMNRELRYLMAELLERGIRLTMIADSCHAGTILRKDKPLPAENKAVARLSLGDKNKRDLASLLDGTVDLERLEELYSGYTLPYTLIAGCLPHQSSYEIRREGDQQVRGVMTSTLLELLENVKEGLSYQELGRALRASIPEHNQKKKQYPNLVGKAERLIFAEEEVRRSEPIFVVNKVLSENEIELEGGAILGLDEGSLLTCFTDWSFSDVVGQWEVKGFSREKGKIRHNKISHNLLLQRASAIKKSGSVPQVGLPLKLNHLSERPTIFFHPTAKEVAEHWHHRSDKNKVYLVESSRGEADYTVQAKGEAWLVQQRDGSQIDALCLPKGKAFRLAQIIDQVICYKEFEALTPASHELLPITLLGEEAGVTLMAGLVWEENEQEYESPLAIDALEAQPLPPRLKKPIHLKFHNQSFQPLYLYLYRLDPDNHLARCIWPAKGKQSLSLAAGKQQVFSYEVDDPRFKGTTLPLKLIVSSEPLALSEWPCGKRGTNHRKKRLPMNTKIGSIPKPRLTGWQVRQLTVSYDSEAKASPIDNSSQSAPKHIKCRRPKNSEPEPPVKGEKVEPLALESSANPTLFFEPNTEEVAELWRGKRVRRMSYLAETKEKDADYIVGVEGESWVVWKADDKNQILSQNQNNLRGAAHIAAVIDQVACYDQFEALAAAPTEQLPISLAGAEAGVKMTATLVRQEHNQKHRGFLPIEYNKKSHTFRQGNKYIEVKLHNQSPKTLYAYLYQLDGERHVAEKLWPSDGSSELAANEWRVIRISFTHRNRSKNQISLKLLVSSEPLEMPKWPCGQKGTDEPLRGARMKKVRALKPRLIGWAAQEVVIKSLREVELEE